jgi:alkylation response protein AidB-like acyl-CoA dehydrogenase
MPGLIMILVDLDQPGVETRPIRAASGRNEFAEIVFDDAEVSRDRVLGQLGDGWRIAMACVPSGSSAAARSAPCGGRDTRAGHLDRQAAAVGR